MDLAAMDRSRRLRNLIIVICVTVIVVIYVVGVVFFWGHFYPSSSLFGTDVSWQSKSVEREVMADYIAAWSTHVQGDGIDTTVTASDIGLSLSPNAALPSLRQHAETWPFEIFGDHNLNPRVSITLVDTTKLNECIGAVVDKANEESTPPTDAHIVFSDADKTFVIEPDALGTAVDKNLVATRVASAGQALSFDVKLGENELVQPSIKKDDEAIVQALARAKELGGSEVSLKVGENEVAKIDSGRMSSWVRADGTNVFLDGEAMAAWARGELSDSLDTLGKTRKYKRADGKEVEVPGGKGSYGWVIDGSALAADMKNRIESGDVSAIEVPMSSRGDTYVQGGRDWPAKYVDVDLSEQYVRLYDGDKVIWESECVSGDVTTDHGTPSGVFCIEYKASPMVLVGLDENHDGEPDYRTPVDFWMPFYDGCGLHDATWRGAFGGNIYSGDGSHGCVNLPYGKAQELYGILNEGDVVVVHW